ncbi:MAG: desulfoferrodoxin family protein [Promethearchaeota archaeon]
MTWIELQCKGGCSLRKFLNPGDEPKAVFVVQDTDGLTAREFCNLHGLWK